MESGKNSDRLELNKAIELTQADDSIRIIAKQGTISKIMASITNLLEDKNLKFRVALMPETDDF